MYPSLLQLLIVQIFEHEPISFALSGSRGVASIYMKLHRLVLLDLEGEDEPEEETTNSIQKQGYICANYSTDSSQMSLTTTEIQEPVDMEDV